MVELFNTEQSHMQASILQLASGGIVRHKGPHRKRNEEIKNMEDKFDAGDYILVDYLSAISRWVGF